MKTLNLLLVASATLLSFGAQAATGEEIMTKVRAGGSGVYGPIPMAPNPPEKISDADLKTAVTWVLKL